MAKYTFYLLAMSLCTACSGDSDGDGIGNKEERDLGTDPKLADTDGDGLSDGDELENAADPLVADTDGDGLNDGDEISNGADPNKIDTDSDGYTDRDEVFESKDPADANSVIYKGGWPYVFDKDSIPGGDRTTAAIGKPFARLKLKDQFGDMVDLYDFYNADKPVVIDISAQWCPPCQGLGLYLEGEADDYGFSEMWPAGPEVIARGDVYWITILGEDVSHDPATKPTATQWSETYPNEAVPVLADGTYAAFDFVELTAWPVVILLEPDLTVTSSVLQWWAEFALPELNERYPQ